MKNVKIKEIQPIKRLIQLVDEIESLEIIGDAVYSKGSDSYCIYCFTSGYFNYYVNNKNKKNYGENVLKNKHKLSEALYEGILYMSQDTFCDLLEEHQYLEVKEKFEGIVLRIRKHFPKDYVYMECSENISIKMRFANDSKTCVVLLSWFNGVFYFTENEQLNNVIWEDRDNLIVKKFNPFPQIERGYKLIVNHSGYYIEYIVFNWGKRTLIKYSNNSGYSAYLPSKDLEEVYKVYDHKDRLIWTKEGENDGSN